MTAPVLDRATTLEERCEQDPVIDIAQFTGLGDNVPRPIQMHWSQLVERLGRHAERNGKDGPAWSPVRYRPGSMRTNDGVESVTALVFDVDHAEPAWDVLDGLTYAAHTTRSHLVGEEACALPDCPHWRVIVQLSRPVAAHEWPEVWRRAQFLLASEADPACKDSARLYFWPSCMPAAPRQSKRNVGRPLDPDNLPAAPEEPAAPSRAATSTSFSAQERPGDRFNATVDWAEILSNWTCVTSRGPVRYWRCPNSSKRRGWCATTGGGGYDVLYVFCNAEGTPFEATTSYTKFRAYSLLEHGGDDRAAAGALAERHSPKREPASVDQPDSRSGSDDADKSSDLPEIRVDGRFLREITQDAVAALDQANRRGRMPQRYRRGTALVRVVDDESGLVIQPLSPAALRGALDRAADFLKARRTKQGEVIEPTFPPEDVVADIMVLPVVPFPPLRGLARTPTFDRSGRLLADGGYDAATGIVLDLGDLSGLRADMPIDEARALILSELLVDFPFVDEAGKAHAVALLLDRLVRLLVGAPSPLFLVVAPMRGTGKGLLVDAVSLISLGDHAAVMAPPRNDTEFQKSVTAHLIRGTQIIVLDNVTELRSTTLAAALTAPRWSGRLLGASKMVDVPNDATWVATGNNVELSDDLVRRVVSLRLDAGVERPEERTQFRHPDLPAWIRRHRTDLVRTCISLIQAWIDAGRPAGELSIGRFEAWARCVGGILDVAGIPGFLTDRAELRRRADQETSDWVRFTSLWAERIGLEPVTAGALVGILLEGHLLPEIWIERSPLRASQRLGHALRARRDRVYGPYKIRVAGEDTHTKATSYRLERVEPGQSLAGNPKTPETPT